MGRVRGALLGLGLSVVGACSRPNPAFLIPAARDAAPSADAAAPGRDTGPELAAADTGDAGGAGPIDLAPDLAPDVAADLAPDVPVDLPPDLAPDLPPDLPPPLPPRVMIGASGSPTPHRGGNGGGSPVTDQCQADEAVVGYHGTEVSLGGTTLVGGMQLVCARLTFTSSAAGTRVQVSNYRPLPRRGDSASGWMQLCDAGQVVATFAGQEGSSLDRIELRCASLTIASDGRSAAVGTTAKVLGPHGGTGGDPFADQCPSGQVVHGGITNFGTLIDGFRVLCAPVTLVP